MSLVVISLPPACITEYALYGRWGGSSEGIVLYVESVLGLNTSEGEDQIRHVGISWEVYYPSVLLEGAGKKQEPEPIFVVEAKHVDAWLEKPSRGFYHKA